MLEFFQAFGDWLRAIPGPTEHWATILSAWAWPTAILIAAYRLRSPILRAADRLAERFGRDDIELGSFLKIAKTTPLTTLDRDAVTEERGTSEAHDVTLVEALLEYAGESDAHAARLLNWISEHGGAALDAEDFLTKPDFAELRKRAYAEFVGGSNG